MLAGIVSDSHDNLPQLRKAVACFNDASVDLVLHCGDFISPFCSNELRKLRAGFVGVFGNNDGEHRLWYEKAQGWAALHEGYYEARFDDISLVMMHEPRFLDALAASKKYDVILYGHTHQVDHRTIDAALVLNPGECGAWLTGRSTVALLDLPSKEVKIIDLGC